MNEEIRIKEMIFYAKSYARTLLKLTAEERKTWADMHAKIMRGEMPPPNPTSDMAMLLFCMQMFIIALRGYDELTTEELEREIAWEPCDEPQK